MTGPQILKPPSGQPHGAVIRVVRESLARTQPIAGDIDELALQIARDVAQAERMGYENAIAQVIEAASVLGDSATATMLQKQWRTALKDEDLARHPLEAPSVF